MPKLNQTQIDAFQRAFTMEPEGRKHRSQKRKDRVKRTDKVDVEKLVRLAGLQGSFVPDNRVGSKIGQTVTIEFTSDGNGGFNKASAYLSVIVQEYIDGRVKVLSGDVWRVRRLQGAAAAYMALPELPNR